MFFITQVKKLEKVGIKLIKNMKMVLTHSFYVRMLRYKIMLQK
jgi:hypothetical protein